MNDRPDNQAPQPVPDTGPQPAEATPERDPAERVDAAPGWRGRFRGWFAGGGADRDPVGAAVDPAPDDDLDLLDPAWTPPQRINRLTLVLAAGLVAALGFAGGVLVQKRHDAGLAGPSAAGAAGRNFRAGAGGGSGTADGTPVVVGKVASVAAGTVVVENFAGTRVTVHVGATTPVTVPGMTGLQVGATVSVAGAKATDGSVNATSVVSRGTGNG